MPQKRSRNSSKKPETSWDELHSVFSSIEKSLPGNVSLAELAFLSASSYFHFHRRFNAIAKEPVGKYVRRLVLERAAYEIKISDKGISEIAFESGFQSHEAFTRAFRRQFNQSPAAYRKALGLRQLKRSELNTRSDSLRFVAVPDFRIVYTRYVGDYETLPGPVSSHAVTQQLEQTASDLRLTTARWVGVPNDDPEITARGKIRFDLGVVVPNKLDTKRSPVRTISGGRYAVHRHHGAYSQLPRLYDHLMNTEIPRRKIRLRNEPPFESYVRRADDESAIVDIYLPIRG